jgi:hypothetical protein
MYVRTYVRERFYIRAFPWMITMITSVAVRIAEGGSKVADLGGAGAPPSIPNWVPRGFAMHLELYLESSNDCIKLPTNETTLLKTTFCVHLYHYIVAFDFSFVIPDTRRPNIFFHFLQQLPPDRRSPRVP